MIVPVILAGGSGTRLWPLSRNLYPKQLLKLVDNYTMLQSTILRLKNLEEISDPIVLCNDDYRFMVAEQFRSIDIKPESIILEPVGRNTAPAVTVAALSALSQDTDAVLLVLPADHFIRDIELFHATLRAGIELANQDYLITFGIVPDAPETGYGYIRKGNPIPLPGPGNPDTSLEFPPEATTIDRFIEKPDLETAEQYLRSGEYCWNSGMFMFKATKVLSELEIFSPDIVKACRDAFEAGRSDLDFFRLDTAAFAACPSDSIDYAVMEKTGAGAMLMFRAGWNDLGSWEALWQVGDKNADQNILVGDVLVHDVKNSYLHATERMIAAVGLENHIVVETADAVLISPRDRAQDVKYLVEKLKAESRSEVRAHRKSYRPWGTIETLVQTEGFYVNRITIKPGAKMSLQKHYNRAEHWVAVKGTALVTRNDEQFVLKTDESTYISPGVSHRLENPGKIPLEIIEVQSGVCLDEDIVRLDNVYVPTD